MAKISKVQTFLFVFLFVFLLVVNPGYGGGYTKKLLWCVSDEARHGQGIVGTRNCDEQCREWEGAAHGACHQQGTRKGMLLLLQLLTVTRMVIEHERCITSTTGPNGPAGPFLCTIDFRRDNNCTIEFDAFGFSVKDFLTRHILLRCDSSGDLYPVTKPSTTPTAFLSTSASTWHQRLRHPGDEVLRSLVSRQFISCNKEKSSHICHACQLGKHVKLPFHFSDSIVEHYFDIIHSDLWTSPIWCNAMYDEYNALVKNGTWLLVPRPAGVNMVHSMWLFKHKFHADETLSCYKARLVSNGSSQQLGVDFDETISPVVKPATIRMVSSLVVSRKWPIHQLDVKNAFLNGDLSETVYMHQPPGFVDVRFPNHVCHLQRSLYGLKQAPRAWFKCFAGLFLSQRKYALQLLERAHMVHCNPSRTSIDTKSKLGPDGVPVQDPTLYRSLAGGLQYLTFTRNVDFGLQLYAFATTSLVGYIDVDWAGCPSTRGSTSGYCVFLGDNLLSWSAKRQHTLSRSSAEAEYRGVANVFAETTWLRNLLRESHSPLSTATLVYCDNQSFERLKAH
ncbi:ribonuclease H-like domain-containing protein [Tanacetum coccineum]